MKTKNLQLLLNEKWYAEGSEAGEFLNSNFKNNSKILKKKYAERSEAKKIWKKLDRAPKCSILGPQNLGSGGGPGPRGPPRLDPLVQSWQYCRHFVSMWKSRMHFITRSFICDGNFGSLLMWWLRDCLAHHILNDLNANGLFQQKYSCFRNYRYV